MSIIRKETSSGARKFRKEDAWDIHFEPKSSGLTGTDLDATTREIKTTADALAVTVSGISGGSGGTPTTLSSTLCDMKTAATTSLYVVPAGKKLLITGVVIHGATASLAGGTDYDIGEIGVLNWHSAANLSTITDSTLSINIGAYNAGAKPTFAATKDIGFAPQTGSTLAANATVELIGYLV